jgi:hypothetical protein
MLTYQIFVYKAIRRILKLGDRSSDMYNIAHKVWKTCKNLTVSRHDDNCCYHRLPLDGAPPNLFLFRWLKSSHFKRCFLRPERDDSNYKLCGCFLGMYTHILCRLLAEVCYLFMIKITCSWPVKGFTSTATALYSCTITKYTLINYVMYLMTKTQRIFPASYKHGWMFCINTCSYA